jgi:hypothetical protein
MIEAIAHCGTRFVIFVACATTNHAFFVFDTNATIPLTFCGSGIDSAVVTRQRHVGHFFMRGRRRRTLPSGDAASRGDHLLLSH